MNNELKIFVFTLFSLANISYGFEHNVKHGKWLNVVIAKSSLNRISNYPYKIIQVVGDDSKFRIKYDDDGSSIYIMPLTKSGSIIDLSIRNDIGITYDLELQVLGNKKAQTINLDSINTHAGDDNIDRYVALMLRAMKDNISGNFYVQNVNLNFTDNYYNYLNCGCFKKNNQKISIVQTKLYKYKRLVGSQGLRMKNFIDRSD